MINWLLIVLGIFNLNVLCANQNNDTSAQQLSVIVDTDMGNDDVMALQSLLRKPNIQVKAITVSGTGLAHAKEGLHNVRRLLYFLNKREIPTACGREFPIKGGHSFPDTWRAETDALLDQILSLEHEKISDLSSDNAVELLRATIESSSEKITILALGPLTNIAELFNTYPALIKKIEKLHIMGGAIDVPGNLSVITQLAPYLA
jgi:pyrimidine-specific ribonucleoside hydrolase